MKKLLFTGMALTVLLGACKKDDGGGNNSASRPDILKKGSWMATAQKSVTTINGVAFPENDDYADLDACEKDDLTIFRSDMKLITDQGASKCNPSDPQQSEDGTWELIENNTKLKFVDGSTSFTGSIEQMDDNTLKIKVVESETISGVTYSYVINTTFTHKP